MRLVRRNGKFELLRHRWKHASAIFVGALMAAIACIAAAMSNDLLDMSRFALARTDSRPAASRRLGYPEDYLIGRWTEGGKETFDKETITDPKYPGSDKTIEEFVGQYKHAPAGRKLLIVVHIIGTIYMLVGLNTVCDIYFCGALDVMVDAWKLPPDVAGATLMAAGGSAPELFTSIIGTVIVESDVGFSTIVGSAVFNVLAVIGCCGMAAKEPIKLTWWPLFRDCTFYVISLGMLAGFASGPTFADDERGPDGQKCLRKKCGGGKIFWYEALILFLMYIIYCIIAKYNERLQAMAQEKVDRIFGGGESSTKVEPMPDTDNILPEKGPQASYSKGPSTPVPKSQTAGTLTHANTMERRHRHHGDPDFIRARYFRRAAHHASMAFSLARHARSRVSSVCNELPSLPSWATSGSKETATVETPEKPSKEPATLDDNSSKSSDDSDDIAALVTVPDGGFREKALWAFCLPVCAPMYLLIPRPDGMFMACFGVALIFIAFYSYWLVYCVQMFSDAILCSLVDNRDGVNVVMGFTLLAAGTSIPDLVSSMVVARAGEGDMAVSSSIGSNIFDILVGLPIPWLMKTLIVDMAIDNEPERGVPIASPYIGIYVLLLLVMVTAVLVSIVLNKWFLNKKLGMMMGCLYFVFLAIVIPLELFEYL